MATVTRRVKPDAASARASSTPVRRTESRGTGFVSTKVSDRQGPYHEDTREVEVLREMFDESDPPAYVKVGGGLTINQGNFESLRIDCSVSLPCKRDSIEQAYIIASDFVADKIAEEQTAWLGTGNVQTRKSKK